MTHLYSLSEVRVTEPTVLAIGVFDGVHVGHQALLKDMVRYSIQHNCPSVVVTYYPSPSVVLGKHDDVSYINHPEEKAMLLEELGIDFVVTLEFNRNLANVTPENYMLQLRNQLKFKHLWCSDNFAFGNNREGNIDWLKDNSGRFGFHVMVTNPVYDSGSIISSSRVRNHIVFGEVREASLCLGRPLRIPGVVIKGLGRGNIIGYPTANLSIWKNRAYPSKGVYLAYAIVDDIRYPAVVNVGTRPTFDDKSNRTVIEAHLIDYSDNLYNKEIVLEFVERLRDERKFDNVDNLVSQINRDILAAKSRLLK